MATVVGSPTGERDEQSVESVTEDRRLADAKARALLDAELQALGTYPLRRPSATYRLQVHGGFRFEDVEAVVDYLSDLGVSDCYFSPYLEARPGSTHGYDAVDPGKINPEIGDESAHDRLVAKLRTYRMGRVIDIVPNHMGVGGDNRFWLDVLESGPQAQSARFFDIDWTPVKSELQGRVLLPILEDLYGKVLESGLLVLERDRGSFWIRYHDRKLPLNPRSYIRVLGRRAAQFHTLFDAEDDDAHEFLSIRDSILNLPGRDARAPADLEHVRREKEVIKRRLERLFEQSPDIRAYVDHCVADFRGTPGASETFDELHALLEDQVYRLAFWRVASEEINYRRFFDVTDLAGVRVEDPRIFDLNHALIFRWVDEGGVTALRVDHPDGLADPLGYFKRIQERLFLLSCRRRLAAEKRGEEWGEVVDLLRSHYRRTIADDPSSPLARRFPIVAEKILSRGETLPQEWPIDGTVGYEFLNALNGLFVDAAASDAVLAAYREFTGDNELFDELVTSCKLLILDVLLASELNALVSHLHRVAERGRLSRDFTLNDLRRVLREVIACFRIYRTYIRPGDLVSQRDRDAIDQAVARARQRRRSVDDLVFSFVNDVLKLAGSEGLPSEIRTLWERLVIRFQQTTGPIQAKGLEDTAFYRQVPLVSLNEVGGDPARLGTSPGVFHALNDHRVNHWPNGFSTTSTHDTKRGEDARIRIDAISELIDEWRTRLPRWSRWNARKKVDVRGSLAPDACEEYLLYQALIGSWPFEGPDDAPPEGYTSRIQDYMVKAIREAKRNTSWTDPDPTYAETVRQYVSAILDGADAQAFLKDFLPFQRRIARIGVIHSLSQTLLKLTSPGVPDIYQGSELWDFRLVDPDNRTPVDYDVRRRLLSRIDEALAAGTPRADLMRALLERPEDGAIKIELIRRVLNHRRENQPLYQSGIYRPLDAQGELRGQVVAFGRRYQDQTIVVIASRLVSRLMGEDSMRLPVGVIWEGTELILPDQATAPGWRNLLTDEWLDPTVIQEKRVIKLSTAFETLPLALLIAEENGVGNRA